MKITAPLVAAAAAATLAACSSSSTPAASKAPVTVTVAPKTSATPTPTPTVDPNTTACAQASDYVAGTVRTTFNQWKPDTNEFDTKIGTKLRNEGTHLYAIAGKATGSTAEAITDEAKGLINISIAIDEQDDTALGTASNDANTALATLRGACNF